MCFRLIDGENVTMCDEHMWLIPFTSGGNHFLTITLKEAREITGLRLWNYNNSQESTYRGVGIAIDDYHKIGMHRNSDFFKVPVPAGTHENVRPEPELFASHV